MENIFKNIPGNLPEELVKIIVKTDSVRIERIVSKGHSSPEDFWYNQNKNEYVILLKGEAKLLIEGNNKLIIMKPGDYLNIPAYVKHRVEWTSFKEDTVWLAVHY